MKELTTIPELRATLNATRAGGKTVGLVPTMGFLHEGHTSLMVQAKTECDLVVTTIFVNPLQFGPREDLDTYPRDLVRDRMLAQDAGVDILFVPPLQEMYPEPTATTVSVAGVSDSMEGASRPTHFAGVATVVAKLFNLAGECRTYFGEKDFQQIAVVRRMARDLSFPVEVVACPTVRETDGLALSSRNAYLTEEERTVAPLLQQALQAGVQVIKDGERDGVKVKETVQAVIDKEPKAAVDYVELVDPDSLEPLGDLATYAGRPIRLLAAMQLGIPRLLDNVGVVVPETAA